MSDSLRRVLTGTHALYDTQHNVNAKESHKQILSTAHGWYTLVSRSVSMLTLPAAQSYQDTLCTVRRSAIEHVAALYFLADQGDAAVGAIDTHNSTQNDKLLAALDKAKWKHEPYKGALPEVDSENLIHNLKNAADRIQRYGGGLGSDKEQKATNARAMYVAYLSETFHSHPSWRSASPYVTDNGDSAILERTAIDVQPDPIAVGVMLLLPASDALNQCLEGEPWTQRIADLDSRASALLQKQRDSA